VDPDYFKNQVDISEHMRQVLLGWMVDAHLKYKLQPETLFIAVHIIDACLNIVSISRTKLQLLGITALWISSKFEETYQVPKIDNWV
jgi:cyclin B